MWLITDFAVDDAELSVKIERIIRITGQTDIYGVLDYVYDDVFKNEPVYTTQCMLFLTDGEHELYAPNVSASSLAEVKRKDKRVKGKVIKTYQGPNEKWAKEVMNFVNTKPFEHQNMGEIFEVLGDVVENVVDAVENPQVLEEMQSGQRTVYGKLHRAAVLRPGSLHLNQVPWPKSRADSLKGDVFFITGILDTITNDDLEKLIRDCGGKLMTCVSKKLTALITGRDCGEKKHDDAVKKEITMMEEEAIYNYINKKIHPAAEHFTSPLFCKRTFLKEVKGDATDLEIRQAEERQVVKRRKVTTDDS